MYVTLLLVIPQLAPSEREQNKTRLELRELINLVINLSLDHERAICCAFHILSVKKWLLLVVPQQAPFERKQHKTKMEVRELICLVVKLSWIMNMQFVLHVTFHQYEEIIVISSTPTCTVWKRTLHEWGWGQLQT